MNCEDLREAVWSRLDGAVSDTLTPEARAHQEGCPACRGYADRARGLDALIRSALRTEAPAASLAPRVLARIRAAELVPEPTPAGLFLGLTLTAAAWRLAWPWGGQSLLAPFAEAFRLPEPELALLAGVSAPPLALTLGTLALAGLLWLSTMRTLLLHPARRNDD
ncbi:MAG: hypothetical protein A2X36_13555 [Elusimicrobia bacterium GWA2_69_24]|nr:MAG: hypothetical protein A2X36_13555 [Elusimicrobia bacterium GWA2_69_24]HBL19037.1 hypothetical protein [Elusimicrobiota bacterium]